MTPPASPAPPTQHTTASGFTPIGSCVDDSQIIDACPSHRRELSYAGTSTLRAINEYIHTGKQVDAQHSRVLVGIREFFCSTECVLVAVTHLPHVGTFHLEERQSRCGGPLGEEYGASQTQGLSYARSRQPCVSPRSRYEMHSRTALLDGLLDEVRYTAIFERVTGL